MQPAWLLVPGAVFASRANSPVEESSHHAQVVDRGHTDAYIVKLFGEAIERLSHDACRGRAKDRERTRDKKTGRQRDNDAETQKKHDERPRDRDTYHFLRRASSRNI